MEIVDVIIFCLVVILTLITINLLFIRSIFVFILNTTIISLCSALIYFVTDAVDVAFTEAAVGAGVSTALFLSTLHITRGYKIKDSVNTKYSFTILKKILIALVFVSLIVIFSESLIYIPPFENANNPIHNDIYKVYITESYALFKVPNAVTMILGSYRGFDTLGETTVVFIAALGVFLTLNSMKNPSVSLDLSKFFRIGTILNPTKEYVLSSGLFTLLPFILLYGFYIQFHGDFGPGGGFQAGVCIASAYILFLLFYNKNKTSLLISDKTLITLLSLGCLIYLGTGLLTYMITGSYLDYYALGKDYSSSYHYGLFVIELGVGITVFAAMSLIIGQFYSKITIED